MAGAAENPFQVSGTAVRAFYFDFFIFVHYQYFNVFITVQAFEFIYRHPVPPLNVVSKHQFYYFPRGLVKERLTIKLKMSD